METAQPQPLIDSLLEIRSGLRDNLREAECLSDKLRGPRPTPEGTDPKRSTESIGDVVNDIRMLTAAISKVLCDHHGMIGGFQAKPSTPGRAIA